MHLPVQHFVKLLGRFQIFHIALLILLNFLALQKKIYICKNNNSYPSLYYIPTLQQGLHFTDTPAIAILLFTANPSKFTPTNKIPIKSSLFLIDPRTTLLNMEY